MKPISFFIFIMMLVFSCGPSQREIKKQQAKVVALQKIEIIKAEKREKQRLSDIERLKKERIAEIERNKMTPEKIDAKISELKSVDFSQFTGTVENVMKGVEFFRMNCHFAMKANLEQDESVVKKAKEYEAFFKKLQKREFPVLRAEYIRLSKRLLWEHDIKVSGSGSSITYTAGIFATNANIKAFHEKLTAVLYDLRFKRANYKWYEYDDEYQYYTIGSPKDNELI